MTTKRYGRYTVEISSPDKVLFPDSGITKAAVVDYYDRIAEQMLPHVAGRIATMHRFPNGINGKRFYQKDVPEYFPEWIRRVTVDKEDGKLEQLVIQNRATLVYLANQACITPHVWLSREAARDRPDRMIFDLDPASGDFAPVRDAARGLRQMLRDVGLESWVMTTGSRGLHVVVALDESATFEETRDFARRLAESLAVRDSRRFTTEQRKNKRRGRLFLDTLRNAYGQHGVAPYSLRAKPGAPIATPLDWDELGRTSPQKYTIKNIFYRLGRKTDPWNELGHHGYSVSRARERLEAHAT